MEDHPESLKVLRRNLEDLGLADRTTVLAPAGGDGLEETGRPGRAFRPGLPGPPLRRRGGGRGLDAPWAPLTSWPGARVVVEHSRRESLPEVCGALTRLEVRRYGDTQVAFYLAEEPAQEEHE